jgi:hypothetical protein
MAALRSAATVPPAFWWLSSLPASCSCLKRPEAIPDKIKELLELTGLREKRIGVSACRRFGERGKRISVSACRRVGERGKRVGENGVSAGRRAGETDRRSDYL